MPASRMPVYFQQLVSDFYLTTPVVGKMGEHDVMPLKGKLPFVGSKEPCLKTADSNNWVGDISAASQNISQGIGKIDKIRTPVQIPMGGFSFLLSGLIGIGKGAADIRNEYKNYYVSKAIGDVTGQRLAILNGTGSCFTVGGSLSLLGYKTFSVAQELGLAMNHPITFTGGLAAAQGAFSWASSVIFALQYIIYGIRQGYGLISWYQGRLWRQELLKSADPLQALYMELKDRAYQTDLTEEQEMELALKTGARWLEKVEDATEGKLNIPDKEEAFRNLIMEHPEIIRDLIGEFGLELTPEGELLRFGKYMAYQNECAKFEAECARKLGSKAVDAMKANDPVALQKALQFQQWIVLSLKIVVAAIGLVAVIAAAIVITGSPIGIALVLAGIAALAMIYISDGKALKDHFQNGDFKRRDRAFFYFTLTLSIVSFVGVVALAIATGGVAPFAVSLILSATWLAVNINSGYMLWCYDNRRWKVQKEVDLVTYRKFLETKPAQAEVDKIKSKLSDASIGDLTVEQLKKAEKAIQEKHEKELKWLIDALKVDAKTKRSVHWKNEEGNQRIPDLFRIRKGTKSSDIRSLWHGS